MLQIHQTLRLTQYYRYGFPGRGGLELISWASLIVALVFGGIDPVNQTHLHELRRIKKVRDESGPRRM